MKKRSATFIPIVIAVVVTGGLGLYIKTKRKSLESPPPEFLRAYQIPKDLRLEILEMSNGPAPKDMLTTESGGAGIPEEIRPAVWVRYEAFADGKKRTPKRTNDRLIFEVLDQQGRLWPSKTVERETANYLFVPKGYSVYPRSLTLVCKTIEREVGKWKLPALPPVERRHLKTSPRGAVAKDFPGLKVSVVSRPEGERGVRSYSVEIEKPAKEHQGEAIFANLIGHEYGVLSTGKGSFVAPEHYVGDLKDFEVQVLRHAIRVEFSEITLPAGKVEKVNTGRTLILSSNKPIRIKGGYVTFYKTPRIKFAGLGAEFKMDDGQVAFLQGCSSDQYKVSGSGAGLVFTDPRDLDALPSLKLKLIIGRSETTTKNYVLPIRREAALPIVRQSKPAAL